MESYHLFYIAIVTGTHCTVYSRDFSKFFSGRIEHATTVSTARARVTIFFIVDVVLLKYPVIITQYLFSLFRTCFGRIIINEIFLVLDITFYPKLFKTKIQCTKIPKIIILKGKEHPILKNVT
jgi:hypothetical protein